MDYEKRAFEFKDFKTREEGDDLFIEGYFARFDGRYELWGKAFERIAPGAFEATLLTDDIRALINHDSAMVLGRTKAGTLELQEDSAGLWGQILINRADQDAMNLYERVKRGDVNQCSFGFDIISQEITELPDGTTEFLLKEVKLYEVSVVTFPAYENTSVEARQKERYEDHKEKQLTAWRSKMLKKLKKEE